MTVKAVKVALQELPKGSKALDLAYEEALQRIESQKLGCQQLAKSIMSWIVCAQKQLTTPELRYALAIEDESSELDEDNLPDMSEVITVCAGLVIIDEKSDVVRLVHYTAQDFFERTTSVWAPFAEEMIAKSCLTYLSLESVVESCSNFVARKGSTGVYDDLCRDNVLVRYAAYYWGYHAEKGWTDSVERRVIGFLEDKKRVTTCFDVNFDPRGPAIGRRREVTAMHLLAYLGLPTVMSKLLCEGHFPDAKTTNGKTPLFYACCKGVGPIAGGQEEVVRLLLSQKGVDVNSMDESGSAPLSMAAWYDRAAIATSLLNHQGIRINSRNNRGQTPLMVAVETESITTAQILLERYGIEQLDVTAGEGADLLDLVITKGSNTIARHLLQRYNIRVSPKAELEYDRIDCHGGTALTKAVEAGNHEIANLLLHRAGIQLSHHDLMAIIAFANTGGVRTEQRNNLKTTLKATKLYVEDNCGRKLLVFSAVLRLRVVLNLSLKPDGVWMNRGPENVSKILLSVVRFGLEDAVVLLLRTENIQPNFGDELGRTALMVGAEEGYECIVGMLLKEDDVNVNSTDCDDRNALMLAAQSGSSRVVAMLLDDPGVRRNERDKDGRTALMLAAQSGYHYVVAMLLKSSPVWTNYRDKDGRTALMLAAQSGYPQVVAMLLQNSHVLTDCEDKDGRTALMLAAGLGYTDVVNQLLAKDCGVKDRKDLQGRTAMSLAALGEHTDVMSLLAEWDN